MNQNVSIIPNLADGPLAVENQSVSVQKGHRIIAFACLISVY